MKLNRTQAVAFLESLGFSKAAEYDNAKLKERLVKVPLRLTKDQVLEEHRPLFDELSKAGGDVEVLGDVVEVEVTKPAAEKPAAKKTETKKPAAKKPAAKAEVKSAAKKPAAKKPVAEKTAKPTAEKDVFGNTVGTIRSKVSLAVDGTWSTHDEVAQRAETKSRQTKLQLRRLVKAGLVEKRRRVEYRLVEKKAKK